MVSRALHAIASLRLTVSLLSLAMCLIFCGTLAQATDGIGQTIDGYFRSAIAWIDLQLFVPRQLASIPYSVPFPGGATLSALLIFNLLAAHAIRFKHTRKRLGILLLHAGLILLLAGEFVTGWFSREGMITIDEGSSSNFVEDAREVELALIDISSPQTHRVTAIPQSLLEGAAGQSGERIAHASLPIEIEVERWMANSVLERNPAKAVATAGIGIDVVATPVPPVSGVETDRVDAPTGYVTFYRNGQSLGRWLVSLNLLQPQRLEVDGRTFEFAIRFKRTYKPYTLELIDFRHDKFVGTEVARNFSSKVRLTDPSRNTDRTVLISMNNPLRYAGETFYQASFKQGDTGTILLVVRNPGWLIPYIACTMVGLGMLYHFAGSLLGFLRRRHKVQASAARVTGETRDFRLGGVFPWIGASLGLVIALAGLFQKSGNGAYDIASFGRIPVSAGGRVKPFDTVARNALMVASGRQSVRTASGSVPAMTFLLDLMARPDAVKDYPVIRVDHPDVLALLDRTPEQAGRLPLTEVEPHWARVIEQVDRASQIPERQRDPFERAVLELYRKVTQLLDLSRMQAPYAIPPMDEGAQWQPFHDAFLAVRSDASANAHPAVNHIVSIMTAYHEEKPEVFNASVSAYRDLLDRFLAHDVLKAKVEVLFNQVAPFRSTTAVYVLAFLFACAALLGQLRTQGTGRVAENLRRVSLGLLLAAIVVHTVAIGLRIYLQGRPPVTNLYSSAVFIGWACVLMALVAERLFPLGLAALGGSTIGTATLIVAHNLGNDGDTMQMMQAVLDSNFWLATHVITITLGYASTFLAGILAVVYLLLGFFTGFMTRERCQVLMKMIYGIVCFALLFSFVGTVLGGIWADQSWGRFWGWDPKENGAALVVLINAIILHARFGGLVRDRGILFLAIGGNIVTAWSWFGTNMLGIGLHSYGFMESAIFWLLAFVVSQLTLMAICLLPERAWRSGVR